ncbi:MAG: hypothetical protein KKC85_12290 [Gammaproteobacteria bacterium]|nr:hypothetical protein [Gammaproteobacteria bacterium]MBU1440368.1 hypothetical protein [Gammaproteobacteria bacterium]MBU2287206.1 hypothetical protein [Gammaproteobacteria bacterium]
MNAHRISFIASLVIAGAAAVPGPSAMAQTVPAEAWVGPAIPVFASSSTRDEVERELQASHVESQAPAEAWVGSVAAAGIPATSARRAEVAADFEMYRRSGLSDSNSDYFNPYGAEEQRRLANYAALRSAPMFAVDVARIEGAQTTASFSTDAKPGSQDE